MRERHFTSRFHAFRGLATAPKKTKSVTCDSSCLRWATIRASAIFPLESMSFESVKALVEDDLRQVDVAIRNRLASDVVLVNQIAEYIVGSGGKRLRHRFDQDQYRPSRAGGWNRRVDQGRLVRAGRRDPAQPPFRAPKPSHRFRWPSHSRPTQAWVMADRLPVENSGRQLLRFRGHERLCNRGRTAAAATARCRFRLSCSG